MTRPTGEDAMNSEHVKALRELRDTGDVSDWRLFESALDAAIAALSAEAQAGDWVLVPRKPTPEMACAGFLSKPDDNGFVVGEPMDAPSMVWRAMLAAAPQPPAEALRCTCPSGDGSLRWPCPAHPPEAQPVYVGVDLEGGWIRATTPPSAPVGVEAAADVLRKLRRLALVIREHGTCAPLALDHIGDDLERALAQQPSVAPVGEAAAWEKGYKQGILDERISEANIGIAGYGAKVEPARNNPYLAQQPAAPHTCSNCEGVSPESCLFNQQPAAAGELAELVGLLDEVRSHFTRDDDLPDDLLPRIDAALAAQPGGSDNG